MKSSKNKKLLAFFLAALGLSVNSLNVSAKNGQIRENIKFAFGMKCEKLEERKKLDELADEIQEFVKHGEYKDEKTGETINYSYILSTLFRRLNEIKNYRSERSYNSKLYDNLNKKNNNANDNGILNNYPGNAINWKNYLNWIINVNSSVQGGNLTVFNGKIKTALSDLKDKMMSDKTFWSAKAYNYDENTKREKEIENGVTCHIDTEGHLSLELSEGVNEIGNIYTDEDTMKLIKSITIPESVKFIKPGAFSHFTNLERIEIPNSVTTIEPLAFFGCRRLKEITIPNSVTTIGASAFKGCLQLEKIKIPNSVTTIGGSAFDSCVGLKEITIPNSVTTIGQYAFSFCNNLKKVKIAKGNQNIEEIKKIFNNVQIEEI